jgi:hypothetical protein
MVRGLTHWFAGLPHRIEFAVTQVLWVGLTVAGGGRIAAWLLLIIAFRRRNNGRLDLVWFRGLGWLCASMALAGGGLMALANSDTARTRRTHAGSVLCRSLA